MKTSPLAAAIAAVLIAFLTAGASAGTVTEAETDNTATNNSVATSELITSGGYTTTADPNVHGGGGTEGTITGLLTVQLTGHGGTPDVDFYALTFYSSGDIWFDVDGAFAFDVILSLFDGTGTLVAYNDDDTANADTGDDGRNSFLGLMQVNAGTYYLAVSQFNNFASAVTGSTETTISNDARTTFADNGTLISGVGVNSNFGTNGNQPGGAGTYNVNITTSALTNPEPGTCALFALGALGLGAIAHRRRRRRVRA